MHEIAKGTTIQNSYIVLVYNLVAVFQHMREWNEENARKEKKNNKKAKFDIVRFTPQLFRDVFLKYNSVWFENK